MKLPLVKNGLCLLLVWAFTVPAALGQSVQPAGGGGAVPPADFVHEIWTVQDGLPVNSINALIQSRDGYLWAATFDGLVRFDGVRFTVYHTGNAPGLPSNRIVDLVEDGAGSLWMVTEQRHLVRFRNGAFTHFGPDRGVPADAHSLHVDRDGTVWVGVTNGLGVAGEERLRPVAPDVITAPITAIASRDGLVLAGTGGGTVYQAGPDSARVIVQPGSLAGILYSVYQDGAGAIWIATDHGTYRLEPSGPHLVLAISSREVHGADDGRVWVLTQQGVHRIYPGPPVQISHQPQSVGGVMFLTDQTGHVWFAAGTEVYREEALVHSLAPRADHDPVPAAEARAIVRDHEGSVWIGTSAAGLHRLKPALFSVYGLPEGLPHQNVYPILEDTTSGTIWMGTWGGGLARLVEGAGRVSPVPGAGAFVLSLMKDRAGRIWVGHFSGGLRLCHPETLRCREHPDGLRYGTVWATHQDRSGAVWLGTNRGLYRAGPEGMSRVALPADITAPVRAFLETSDGALWMGTNGAGLLRYHQGVFAVYGTAEGGPSDLIRALHQDADGWLWVGTEGHGLARLDPVNWPTAEDRSSALLRIGPEDGLFDQVIHRILEDAFGRMWMSTNRGIFWVPVQELRDFAEGRRDRIHSTGYTERQGLRNREANGGFSPAGIAASDGRLWFPTQDGAAVVDPTHLAGNLAPPPVVVERLASGTAHFRPDSQAVRLAADQRDLQIDYTALSFVAPKNVRFRYRLEGYQEAWVQAGNRRTAFYTNIPPGDYTFHVIAANEEGIWNEAGATMAFAVAPYFHETTTYYVLLITGLVLVTLVGFEWRARSHRRREAHLSQLVEARTAQLRSHEAQLEAQNDQLERQAARLTELDQAKSRFFANVSHEFRTPLTLTIGPLEDVRDGLYGTLGEESARQVGMALRNARRLLRLVNQIMDVAKLESGDMKLRANRTDVAEFVRDLAASFAPVAERQRVRFDVAVPAVAVLLWFDREALETVLINLLSNAFKFTPEGGTVSLGLTDLADGEGAGIVEIRVADSGRGIPAEDLPHVFDRFYQVDESTSDWQAGTGIGLSLAHDLVRLQAGDLRVESERGRGTTFTVALPHGRAHLRDDQILDPDVEASPHPEPVRSVAPPEEADVSAAAEPVDTDQADPDDVPTVLVVDDNADVRDYIRGHLARRYRVVEAGDGVEGLALAETLVPDLIISDVMMPGLDGYGLCRSLRGNPEIDFVPVILLTAKADTEHKVAGLTDGADDYVVKPFAMEELEARVANLLTSRRRLRERFAGQRLELHARDTTVTSADTAYLERVREAIESHLEDEHFGVAQLAEVVGQDRSHVYRRLRALLDETPTELIRRLRLERASQLLAAQAGTVAEVGYAVGFNSVSYFCKCFREAYGVTPSAFKAKPQDQPH
jgi:signal transduction histidine kinase/DNA-binding response OmpR family regulator